MGPGWRGFETPALFRESAPSRLTGDHGEKEQPQGGTPWHRDVSPLGFWRGLRNTSALNIKSTDKDV